MDEHDFRAERPRRPQSLEAAVGRWTDDHSHDPGIALMELLELVAETLSAQQDRVADESFLLRRRPASVMAIEVDRERWERVDDLLGSGPDDRHFTTSTDDAGRTDIRFGDGVHGRRPPDDATIRAGYRVGAGLRFLGVKAQQGRVVVDADWNESGEVGALHGLFRGIVLDNVDPMRTGRLKLGIPAVSGGTGAWAEPCRPSSAELDLPAPGHGVWVAFEMGDPDHPVWLGRT